MNRFPAWVEIDLDAARRNFERIRGMLPPGVEILFVVKADAYGHGAVSLSRLAAECGVSILGVATVDEGRELRRAGIALPILVLSPVLVRELDWALESDLAVTASSLEFAEAANDAANRKGTICRMHVEVDTGMGRTGLPEECAFDVISEMVSLPYVHLEGIFTHFPVSDSDDAYTEAQVASFKKLVERLASGGTDFRYVHCANSAAIINFPSSYFNLVRPGLLVYGHTSNPTLRLRTDVEPIMSFKARIVLIRDMPAGASVSYGRTFITDKPIRMGIVPVGYGHGLSHRLSNRGRILVKGRLAPIIGRVTMDMSMIDLSEFPDVQVGDEVVIFGRQGSGEITLDEVADCEGTLNYEVLCRISKRVPRIYIRSGRIESMRTLLGVKQAS